MTIKSAIKRLLLGPTLRTLYVHCEDKNDYINKKFGDGNIECRQIAESDTDKITFVQDMSVEIQFNQMSRNKYCVLTFYQKVPFGHASMSFPPNFYYPRRIVWYSVA